MVADSRAGRLLRDSVMVAVERIRRDEAEALADRTGRATAREIALWFATGKLSNDG